MLCVPCRNTYDIAAVSFFMNFGLHSAVGGSASGPSLPHRVVLFTFSFRADLVFKYEAAHFKGLARSGSTPNRSFEHSLRVQLLGHGKFWPLIPFS